MQLLKYISTIAICATMLSCNVQKGSKVKVTNTNAEPVGITIKANNISCTIKNILPNATVEQAMDWSTIEKKDGEYVITLLNAAGNPLQTNNHGVFEKG